MMAEIKLNKYEIFNIECPKCNGKKLIKVGLRRIKRTTTAIQRYRCNSCKKTFTIITNDFGKKKPEWIRQQIKRLYSKEKGYLRKYDNLRKTTYSTREVARMLNVSKTFVHKVLQEV